MNDMKPTDMSREAFVNAIEIMSRFGAGVGRKAARMLAEHIAMDGDTITDMTNGIFVDFSSPVNGRMSVYIWADSLT